MRTIVSAVALGALALVACGAPPGDTAEDTATNDSALTPIKGNPLPPWLLYSSGIQAGWVDAGGGATTSLTLYYERLTQKTTHAGTLDVLIWDDLATSGLTDDCSYALFVRTTPAGGEPWSFYSDTKGPLLCNGAPYLATAPADALPLFAWIDMLTEATQSAIGDTLADACEATNQHGLTVATPLYVSAWATGMNPTTGVYTTNAIATAQPVTVNVTLMCEE